MNGKSIKKKKVDRLRKNGDFKTGIYSVEVFPERISGLNLGKLSKIEVRGIRRKYRE